MNINGGCPIVFFDRRTFDSDYMVLAVAFAELRYHRHHLRAECVRRLDHLLTLQYFFLARDNALGH